MRQAKAIGRAETADPDAGKRLLAAAPTRSAKEIEDDVGAGGAGRVERVRGGAGRAGPAEPVLPHVDGCRRRATARSACLRRSSPGSWRRSKSKKPKVFERARQAGVREHDDAYAADALVALADRPAGDDADSEHR